MLSNEQYRTVIANWKRKAEHTVEEHIVYNVLRGKDPELGFNALTNTGRLKLYLNDPWGAFNDAAKNIQYSFTQPSMIWLESATANHYSTEFGINFSTELMAEIATSISLK